VVVLVQLLLAACESWPGRTQTRGGQGAHRLEGAGKRPEFTCDCLARSSSVANSGGGDWEEEGDLNRL
jgi:hypothetical protein